MKVSPHTNLKHRILGSYFKICRDVMKRKGGTQYYVDLFSGDGLCECDRAPMKQWRPPYFTHIEKCRNENIDLKCIFNDKDKKKIEKLSQDLELYQDNVIAVYSKDANIIYKEILKEVPPNRWSIFVLDPTNHKQLKFSTIEQISKHESYDYFRKCYRKPELIINLMTYTMQQYIKAIGRQTISESNKEKLLRTIDESLGTDKWRNKILGKTGKEREDKVNRILLNVFLEQLGELGYDTVYFHIKQTEWNSVIYYLIFATSIPKAYEIISKKFETYIKKITEDKWIKENFVFNKMAKAREKGIKLLDEFD